MASRAIPSSHAMSCRAMKALKRSRIWFTSWIFAEQQGAKRSHETEKRRRDRDHKDEARVDPSREEVAKGPQKRNWWECDDDRDGSDEERHRSQEQVESGASPSTHTRFRRGRRPGDSCRDRSRIPDQV